MEFKSSTTFQIARFLGAPHSGSTPYPDPGTKSNKKQQAEIRACKKRYTASFAIYCAVMQKIAARCTDLNASSSTKEEKESRASDFHVPPCDMVVLSGDYLRWPSFRDIF